jgi:D-glycero-beta-D-manno-heptose-7-phosphate kinase
MNKLSSDRLLAILESARGKRVAVIGDFMLDRHLSGTVRRISPEAPVPIVEIEAESSGLGGAGNVVSNLAGLGVRPIAFGVIGEDRAGEMLKNHITEEGGDGSGLIQSKDRKTSEKIRIIADDQHVVRADRETLTSITVDEENRLLSVVNNALDSIDAVILQDYNKGVLTERVITELITALNEVQIPVSVDPKFDNFLAYRGVHLFKPNVKEVERALGVRAETDQQIKEVGSQLWERLSPDLLLITRGEKGIALFTGRDRMQTIPTRARQVHDVSGAGDTVISTFAVADLGGASPMEAAAIANLAGGIVCGHVGVVSITISELTETINTFR